MEEEGFFPLLAGRLVAPMNETRPWDGVEQTRSHLLACFLNMVVTQVTFIGHDVLVDHIHCRS